MSDFLPPVTNSAAWMWLAWAVILVIVVVAVGISERRDRRRRAIERAKRNHPTHNPYNRSMNR